MKARSQLVWLPPPSPPENSEDDPWFLYARPVADAEFWYRTGKTRYTKESVRAARKAGFPGRIETLDNGSEVIVYDDD